MKKELKYWNIRAIAPFKGMMFIAAFDKEQAIELVAKAVKRPVDQVKKLKVAYVPGWGPHLYGAKADLVKPTVFNRKKVGEELTIIYQDGQ